MKKTLLSMTCFFAYILSAQSQTLYGTTFNGGIDGGGTINKFIPATRNLTVRKSFESFAANPSYTNFIQGRDGKLYGVTAYGGSMGYGVILSFDPSTSTYTKLKDFDNTDGAYPNGSLLQGRDGKLYGMTGSGGSGGYGVIFSIDPSTSIYAKLKDFDSTNGANPLGSLIQSGNGKLHGLTSKGGRNGVGVIFSLDPNSLSYTKLYDFDNTDGANPNGSLMQGKDGKLYGMTFYGGSDNFGVIFSFDPTTVSYTKLMNFDYIDANGEHPEGSLIQASDGKLYGMTSEGGSGSVGVIFSFDAISLSFKKLKDFDNSTEYFPYGSLMQASDGKLYGMTQYGGTSNAGVIFSFDPLSSTYAKLKDFDYTNGAYPTGSLLQASDKKLYGMTSGGGSGNAGIIFSFDPTGSNYTLLKDFGTNKNGSNISGSLVQASDGKLYGMTTNGGSSGGGVIFSYDASFSTYTKLKDFDYTNGGTSYGSLLQASDGKLYGMTNRGGVNGSDGNPYGDIGVIFSYDLISSTYTKLKNFDNYDSSTGGSPYGSLIQASDGKLYGMTSSGGGNDQGGEGSGTIFSFDPASSTYTKLYAFDNIDGGYPYGSLKQASNGKLYGMTSQGGSNHVGVIFSFDPMTSAYTKLMDFDNTNGANPTGSFVQASDGKLYGMTVGGGSSGYGVIFSFNPSSSTYAKLEDFDNTRGANPYGSLLQAGDGVLYGMTHSGGSNDAGVIFSFNPSSFVYTKLTDYDGANGASPYYGSAFIEETATGPVPVTLLSFTGINNGNSNLLLWKVEYEQNLNYYELQRSINGQNFKEISKIKATGNHSYTYRDFIPIAISSIYYYRLKIVDKDGKFKYSSVIEIRTDHNLFAIVNPNPFKNELVVNIKSLIQDKAIFIVSDVCGRQLNKENRLIFPGTNVVEINEAGRLSKGTYVLTIITSQQTQSIKVVKGD